MEAKAIRFLWGRLGARYTRVALAAQFQFSHLVALGGLGLLTLYEPRAGDEFWRLLLVTEALVLMENVSALWVANRLLRPADPWLHGHRGPRETLAAWRALARLPLDFITYRRAVPVVLNIVPISAYITWELELGLPAFLVLCAGSAVVLLYGVFLRFFAMELLLRPVLEEVSCDLPESLEVREVAVPLRWRLLIALPAMNVITGVVVAGLSSTGEGATLEDLGLDVAVAVAVSFTLALELSVLLARSVLQPVQRLREATERVAEGDLSARVPVVAADETGRLASSFNQMVAGLQERERLREAFGAYVDPVVAERVVREGTLLEGQEADVTILFLDIRDFTAFAERSGAREVVARLNGFYDRVVPVLRRHGGHANRFVGDGLLGIFGTPEPFDDHADRAVLGALDILGAVRDAYGDDLRIGIGINSGTVVAGPVGGGGRVDFTVIGDAVNTASRVEQATRLTGDELLITEATRRRLTLPFCGWTERAPVALKGKSESVRLYAPAGRLAAPGGDRRAAGALGDGDGGPPGADLPLPSRLTAS